MNKPPSLMSKEISEAAGAVAELLAAERSSFARIAEQFAIRSPRLVTTAARGSSDHAATFFKYLFEITTGYPVASIGPSIASVYDVPLKLGDAVHFTVSQSGASPDIVALQQAARRGGALAVAVVNDTQSPLARGADVVIGLHAWPERSVAATKSCIAAAAALAAVTAAVSRDDSLSAALTRLPAALAGAVSPANPALVQRIAARRSLFVAGRGTGFAAALETALKAKETCGLHAEAFSLAELMHGPLRLVEHGFPIVAFTPSDAAAAANEEALERLAALGADVITIGPAGRGSRSLETPGTGHALIDVLPSLAAAYGLVEAVAQALGFDPDKPRHLSKVTETR